MAKRKLLTNGNAFKRTDGRWGGTVWFMDEIGERKRKSFSGTTKQEVNKKMTAYIENFNNEVETSIEANITLKESMTNWLKVFKFPSVERTTYDRYECTAINQIYPLIGNKIVGNITSADIKKVLNHIELNWELPNQQMYSFRYCWLPSRQLWWGYWPCVCGSASACGIGQ